MSDDEKRCGTCRWYEGEIASDWGEVDGTCGAPLPASVATAMRWRMNDADGANCPTWAKRAPDGAASHSDAKEGE